MILNFTLLIIITIILILYNLLFKWILGRWKKQYIRIPPVKWLDEGYFWNTVQVLADYITLTFGLYYSGGVENPFFLTYIVHIIASSSLAPRRIVYRYALAAIALFGGLENNQKEFLEFVLSKYVETGIEELFEEKIPDLLRIKYFTINDAVGALGEPATIRNTFIKFQKHLYSATAD